MRLLFNPSNQIFFKKSDDQRMRGTIQITNPTSDTIFTFKIKCTNPDLFSVTPLKGMIKAGQKILIQFQTNEAVNLDFARELVSKHKFLIQFVPVASELSLANFKSQQSDRKKYYINMDSIRGSRLFKDSEKISMHSAISNKMSYLSMKDQQIPHKKNQMIALRRLPEPKLFPDQTLSQGQQLQEKYSKLKQQLQDLHSQRLQIVNKMSSTRRSSKIDYKKLFVFLIFLVIGLSLGTFIEGFKDNKKEIQQIQRRTEEQTRPYRYFSFLDFLYDQVDPEEV